MALQDLLALSNTKKKIGISEERIEAVKPILRKYIAFWRWYPDLLVDFWCADQKLLLVKHLRQKKKKKIKKDLAFTFIREFFCVAQCGFSICMRHFPVHIQNHF